MLVQEHKGAEVKLHFQSNWTRHYLCHKVFTSPCLQNLLYVAGPDSISVGKFAVHEHLPEHVMHERVILAVQSHQNPHRYHLTCLFRPHPPQTNPTGSSYWSTNKNWDLSTPQVSRRLAFSCPISAKCTAVSHPASNIHLSKSSRSRRRRLKLSKISYHWTM